MLVSARSAETFMTKQDTQVRSIVPVQIMKPIYVSAALCDYESPLLANSAFEVLRALDDSSEIKPMLFYFHAHYTVGKL
jgi:hypothetical protein